jgi:hypothetical protein
MFRGVCAIIPQLCVHQLPTVHHQREFTHSDWPAARLASDTRAVFEALLFYFRAGIVEMLRAYSVSIFRRRRRKSELTRQLILSM